MIEGLAFFSSAQTIRNGTKAKGNNWKHVQDRTKVRHARVNHGLGWISRIDKDLNRASHREVSHNGPCRGGVAPTVAHKEVAIILVLLSANAVSVDDMRGKTSTTTSRPGACRAHGCFNDCRTYGYERRMRPPLLHIRPQDRVSEIARDNHNEQAHHGEFIATTWRADRTCRNHGIRELTIRSTAA